MLIFHKNTINFVLFDLPLPKLPVLDVGSSSSFSWPGFKTPPKNGQVSTPERQLNLLSWRSSKKKTRKPENLKLEAVIYIFFFKKWAGFLLMLKVGSKNPPKGAVYFQGKNGSKTQSRWQHITGLKQQKCNPRQKSKLINQHHLLFQ